MRNVLIGTVIGVILGGSFGWAISPLISLISLISFLPTLSVIAIFASAGGFIGFRITAKYL